MQYVFFTQRNTRDHKTRFITRTLQLDKQMSNIAFQLSRTVQALLTMKKETRTLAPQTADNQNSAFAINTHAGWIVVHRIHVVRHPLHTLRSLVRVSLQTKLRDDAIWFQHLYSLVIRVSHNKISLSVDRQATWTVELCVAAALAAYLAQKHPFVMENLCNQI